MLLWLNLFFLMAVALIPFTISVMSDHQTALPTMMYAAVLMAVALLLAAIWGYACRRRELFSTDVTPVMRRQGAIDLLFVAAVFASRSASPMWRARRQASGPAAAAAADRSPLAFPALQPLLV